MDQAQAGCSQDMIAQCEMKPAEKATSKPAEKKPEENAPTNVVEWNQTSEITES